MKKQEFIERLKDAPPTLDESWIKDVLDEAIITTDINGETKRGHMTLIIAMEELSELIKEISKYLRGKGDRHNILEELADVQVETRYIKEICGISDEELNKAVNVKVQRIKDVVNKNGRYQ